jgi:hypothetical protein
MLVFFSNVLCIGEKADTQLKNQGRKKQNASGKSGKVDIPCLHALKRGLWV